MTEKHLTEADLAEIEARAIYIDKPTFAVDAGKVFASALDVPALLAEVRYLRASLLHLARLTMNPDVYEISTAELQDLAMGAIDGTWKPEDS